MDASKHDNGMTDALSSWASQTAIRQRVLTPLYARAVEEENLHDILLIRSQLAATVMEADKLITDCIVRNIERRIQGDG